MSALQDITKDPDDTDCQKCSTHLVVTFTQVQVTV